MAGSYQREPVTTGMFAPGPPPLFELVSPDMPAESSVVAAKVASSTMSETLIKLLADFTEVGPDGLTASGLMDRHPEMRQSTVARRVTDLHRRGLIVDTGQRRATSSGIPAIVWAVAS